VLFNLEATPAESTSYRLALHDRRRYPDIVTSGGDDPYYTNSSHLPVDYTDDVFDALDHQESLQTKYTGGTVFHAFLGERVSDWRACRGLVQAIAGNYRLPYFTISPTFSVCPQHGYLAGEHFHCPHCQSETEVYTRIVGYYRSLAHWNAGKREEYSHRTEYLEDRAPEARTYASYLLFTQPGCPRCPALASMIPSLGLPGNEIDVGSDDGFTVAARWEVAATPTLILLDADGREAGRVLSPNELTSQFRHVSSP